MNAPPPAAPDAHPPAARVLAVHLSGSHSFGKRPVESIRLLAGLGVEGDAHSGTTVKHRSRVRRDPSQPNLRQVHLLHGELLDDLVVRGFSVPHGAVGENITTAGVALLALPTDTELHIGASAVLRVTGLRNPCHQLDDFQAGLMSAMLERTPDGRLLRKAGVMAVVLQGGRVAPGHDIRVRLPPPPHRALVPV
ncbi:MAG: MOSC domain-containing protein [Chitinophagaceae bacterium]|nr:MOSC domain-containing protein [Rubrivivax sp.]